MCTLSVLHASDFSEDLFIACIYSTAEFMPHIALTEEDLIPLSLSVNKCRERKQYKSGHGRPFKYLYRK